MQLLYKQGQAIVLEGGYVEGNRGTPLRASNALPASLGHTGSCPSPALLHGRYLLLACPDLAGTLELCCALPRPLNKVGPRAPSTPQWELPNATAPTQVQALCRISGTANRSEPVPEHRPVCKGMEQAQGSLIRDQELSSHPGDALLKASLPLEGVWWVRQGRPPGPPATPRGPLFPSLTF